jgi:hypothetical protein
MSTSTQRDQELFRVLLYRNDATELFVETSPAGFRLPAATIPRHTRVAEEVTAAIKESWSLETYCLFTLPASTPGYAVLETCDREAGHPAGLSWMPLDSLPSEAFQDPTDLAAVRTSQETLDQYRRGLRSGVFGRPGWLPIVVEWAGAQAEAAGLRLTGQFRQLNASPAFSLIRFETNGAAIWFKAVGEPNLREYSITLGLAKYFPAFVPRVIARRDDWNGWLAMEGEGTHLSENSDMEVWTRVVSALAEMQIASFGQTLHLLNTGCRDARICTLLELVEPFVEAMAELMERQTKESPPALSRSELRNLQTQLQDTLSESANSEIANAIGHLDFNPGNILANHNGCVFLDWSEGCVGHPFLTFQYLLQHLRRLHNEDNSWESAITSTYLNNWRSFVSPKEITKALNVSPLLAVFAYAGSLDAWHNPEHRTRPEVAGYFRSLTRRMKRETDRWVGHETAGYVPCLR